MNRRAAIAGMVVALALFLIYLILTKPPMRLPRFELEDKPYQESVPRVGINLGAWNSWGAQQYMENVLMNPGFEGVIDRDVVKVKRSEGREVLLENEIELENFWVGAKIARLGSKKEPWQGVVKEQNGALLVLEDEAQLDGGDQLVLTKSWTGEKIAKWWIPDKAKHLVSPSQDSAPHSDGEQSVELRLSEEVLPSINYYLDTIAEKAGKMLPIEGKWKLSFWAKGSNQGDKLRVSFKRIGRWDRKATTFVDRLLALTPSWKEYSLEFLGIDQGSSGPLQLRFEGVGSHGEIHIDDCFLGADKDGASPFRAEVISTLKKLRPGLLRMAQGDEGEPFANLISSPTGRKACRFHPCKGSKEIHYHYGLGDFLSLCKEVDSLPWLQIPPFLTGSEIDQLGDFLKANGTKKIYVETDGAKEMIDRLKGRLGNEVSLVDVNEAEALTSYLVESLEKDLTDEETLSLLYKPFEGPFKEGAYIAEINFGTTQGEATSLERNRLVTSATAGLSLANHIVRALIDGVKAVSVYKLAGYEVMVTEPVKHLSRGMDIKLFGVVRDLFKPGRFRPTGQALALLNLAVGGDLYRLKPANSLAEQLKDKVHMAAFVSSGRLSYVVSSSSDQEAEVHLAIPKKGGLALPKKRVHLAYSDLFDSNEQQRLVKVKSEEIEPIDGEFVVRLPPYGLVVLADTPK